MKNKRLIQLVSVFALIVVSISVLVAQELYQSGGEGNAVNTPVEAILPGDKDPGTQTNQPKETITCFDFIDQLLVADGFKYLSGTRWGRGEKNFFLMDVSTQEFQVADVYKSGVLTDTWFEDEFDRYIHYIYSHATGEVSVEFFLRTVPNATSYDRDLYTTTKEEMADVNGGFYEFTGWMNRYVAEAERFGCPIIGIDEQKLLGEYKSKMSKAEAKDVVSSFDVKSTDGVIRTFKDAFKEGRVQDDPRYKELTSLEEYRALYDAEGFEGFYMTNILYKNPANFVFESGRDGVQGRALESFIKDVVYPNTQDPANNPLKIMTIGVYFIYADNPNFGYIYSAPDANNVFSNTRSGEDLRTFIMPYDATAVYANKGVDDPYKIYPYGVGNINTILGHYVRFINRLNPSVEFSDDFIRNYTRPFDIKWQIDMGLSDFLDEKFGLIDRSIKYLH